MPPKSDVLKIELCKIRGYGKDIISHFYMLEEGYQNLFKTISKPKPTQNKIK